MVVVKTDVGSRLKRHLQIIGVIAKEIIKPSTMTVNYPKEERVYENLRGFVVLDLKEGVCLGCCRCARICPANAILMKKVGGRYYPSIDYGRCIFCHYCVDVCPTGVLKNSGVHDLVFDSPNVILNPDETIKFESKGRKVKFEFDKDLTKVRG
ncbi:4Fe-4S binding protein [Archaeoglobus sp.]